MARTPAAPELETGLLIRGLVEVEDDLRGVCSRFRGDGRSYVRKAMPLAFVD